MKFIRDIISEKRSQAMGQPRVAPEAAPRPPAPLETPRPAPLPQDVMLTARAPAVAKPAFQLPMSALVSDEDDDDILNILNPADDDEDDAPGAIAADDFQFGRKEAQRAFGDVLADEDDEDDATSAVKAAVEADAVVSGVGDNEEDAEFAEAETDTAEEADFDEASLAMAEEPEEEEAPAATASRASLFRAISEMDLAEDDAPDTPRSWTGAMPSAPPRAAEPAPQPARPAMTAPPDTPPAAAPMPPRPQFQPQTQSLSLRANPAPEKPPAAEMPRAAAPAPRAPEPPRAPAPEAPRAAGPMPPRADDDSIDVPSPAIGRGSRRAGRVKTRLLGFNGGQMRADPFAAAAPATPEAPEEDAAPAPVMFPVGWLVVVAGPGTGAAFPLSNGVSQIGRGPGQAIRLDLGDNSISRENHAAIAYDGEQRKFYLGHGGKANLVRLNNRPVLSTEELSSGNTIRIGETTLRFVALCGADFDWAQG